MGGKLGSAELLVNSINERRKFSQDKLIEKIAVKGSAPTQRWPTRLQRKMVLVLHRQDFIIHIPRRA